jgi:hypothetical protein
MERRAVLRFYWERMLSQKARNRVRASRTVLPNREQGNPQKKQGVTDANSQRRHSIAYYRPSRLTERRQLASESWVPRSLRAQMSSIQVKLQDALDPKA